jgi:hypothetical protein
LNEAGAVQAIFDNIKNFITLLFSGLFHRLAEAHKNH